VIATTMIRVRFMDLSQVFAGLDVSQGNNKKCD
jgi:hypothetical protein